MYLSGDAEDTCGSIVCKIDLVQTCGHSTDPVQNQQIHAEHTRRPDVILGNMDLPSISLLYQGT